MADAAVIEQLNTFVGSSGTMVVSVFETLGHYYQSSLLNSLSEPFEGPIGAFVYIFAAVAAILTFVVTGKYEFGRWFFLGPTLFFLVIQQRIPSSGSLYQWGNEDRSDRWEQVRVEVERQKKELGINEVHHAQVSRVFAWYNNLISGVVSNFVAYLDSDRLKADMKFLLRAQLLDRMNSAAIRDPGLRALMGYGLLQQCRDIIDKGKSLSTQGNSDVWRESTREAILRENQAVRVQLSEPALSYMAQLWTDNPALADNGFWLVGSPGQNQLPVGGGLSGQIALGGSNNSAVAQLFNLTSAAENSRAAAGGGINTLADLQAAPSQYEQERASRIDSQKAALSMRSFNCFEIWNSVYAGLMLEGRDNLASLLALGEKRGLAPDEVRQEIYSMVPPFSQGKAMTDIDMVQIIAKKLAQNEISDGGALNILVDQQYGRAQQVMLNSNDNSAAVEYAEYTRAKNTEFEQRNRMLLAAASLPYYQGLALSVLALSFPFFALLLIMPGKHTGFFLWFVLWFWLKSWDIAYAVVMLFEDLLFNMFATFPSAAASGAVDQQLQSDLMIFALTMQEKDPSFAISTFYNIIATSIMGIPVITSYLTVNIAKSGAGLISKGMDSFATGKYGTGVSLSGAGLIETTAPEFIARKKPAG